MKQLLLIIHILLIGLSHSNDSNQSNTSPQQLIASIRQMGLPSNLTTGLDDLSEVAREVLPHILPNRPVTDAAYAGDYTHKYVTVSIPYLLERTKKLIQVFKAGYALYDLGEFPEQKYMDSIAGKAGLTCLEYLCCMRTMTKDADRDTSNQEIDGILDFFIDKLKSGEHTSHILPFVFHTFDTGFNGVFGEAMMNAAMSCGLSPFMSVCLPEVEYDRGKSGPYGGMNHDFLHWTGCKQATLVTEYITGKLRSILSTTNDTDLIISIFMFMHERHVNIASIEDLNPILKDPHNILSYMEQRQREINGSMSTVSVEESAKIINNCLDLKYGRNNIFILCLGRYLLLDFQSRKAVMTSKLKGTAKFKALLEIGNILGGITEDDVNYLDGIYAHFHTYGGPTNSVMTELLLIYRRNSKHKIDLSNIQITNDHLGPNLAQEAIYDFVFTHGSKDGIPDEVPTTRNEYLAFLGLIHITPVVFPSAQIKYQPR